MFPREPERYFPARNPGARDVERQHVGRQTEVLSDLVLRLATRLRVHVGPQCLEPRVSFHAMRLPVTVSRCQCIFLTLRNLILYTEPRVDAVGKLLLQRVGELLAARQDLSRADFGRRIGRGHSWVSEFFAGLRTTIDESWVIENGQAWYVDRR